MLRPSGRPGSSGCDDAPSRIAVARRRCSSPPAPAPRRARRRGRRRATRTPRRSTATWPPGRAATTGAAAALTDAAGRRRHGAAAEPRGARRRARAARGAERGDEDGDSAPRVRVRWDGAAHRRAGSTRSRIAAREPATAAGGCAGATGPSIRGWTRAPGSGPRSSGRGARRSSTAAGGRSSPSGPWSTSPSRSTPCATRRRRRARSPRSLDVDAGALARRIAAAGEGPLHPGDHAARAGFDARGARSSRAIRGVSLNRTTAPLAPTPCVRPRAARHGRARDRRAGRALARPARGRRRRGPVRPRARFDERLAGAPDAPRPDPRPRDR